MNLYRVSSLIAAFGVALASTRIANAQVKASDQLQKDAAAEVLFQNASKELADGHLDKACALFEESEQLSPAGGTLLNLALCLEKFERWASAYARFQELRTVSRSATPPRPDRVKLAEEHVAALEPILSRVVIELSDADRGKDVNVTVDGVKYAEVAWRVGLALDPGVHQIEVSAPDKKSAVAKFQIGGGRIGTRETIRIATLETIWAEAHPTRTAGLVVAGAGVLALGAGAVFGILAVTKNKDGRDACSSGSPSGDFRDGQCIQGTTTFRSANDLKSEARTFANVANVLVPVGLVAGAVGGYLFFRTTRTRQVGFSVGPGSVAVEGAF